MENKEKEKKLKTREKYHSRSKKIEWKRWRINLKKGKMSGDKRHAKIGFVGGQFRSQ